MGGQAEARQLANRHTNVLTEPGHPRLSTSAQSSAFHLTKSCTRSQRDSRQNMRKVWDLLEGCAVASAGASGGGAEGALVWYRWLDVLSHRAAEVVFLASAGWSCFSSGSCRVNGATFCLLVLSFGRRAWARCFLIDGGLYFDFGWSLLCHGTAEKKGRDDIWVR